MPNGGELLIKARTADEAHLPEKLAPGSYVHLSVVDTGLGMDAETLKRASEPFFSTKPKGKGSGLGLSMVHGLTLQGQEPEDRGPFGVNQVDDAVLRGAFNSRISPRTSRLNKPYTLEDLARQIGSLTPAKAPIAG